MKKILCSVLLLSVISCSIDNYEMPNVRLSGKVVDNETGELIGNGGVNNGTLIQLFEGNSSQPVISYSYPDGSFTNNALFRANYKIVAVGAFTMMEDTMDISLNENISDFEIKVLPNIRLKATLQASTGTSATIKVEYHKVHSAQVIDQLAVVWSTIDNPNLYTTYGGGVKIETVSPQNLITGEYIFTVTGLTAGKKYFFRASGRTNAAGGYYNYSKTITTM